MRSPWGQLVLLSWGLADALGQSAVGARFLEPVWAYLNVPVCGCLGTCVQFP